MILCLRTSRKGKNKNKKGYSLQLEVHVLPRVLKRAGVISAVYPKDGCCNVGQVYLENITLNIEVRFIPVKGSQQKEFIHELYKFTQNTF